MFNTNAAKSLLLVAVVVLAMAGGAMAAAPTVNTETTNTTYTTELNDGDTQTYNDTTSSLISWSADSANASIEITHDGDTVYEASPITRMQSTLTPLGATTRGTTTRPWPTTARTTTASKSVPVSR